MACIQWSRQGSSVSGAWWEACLGAQDSRMEWAGSVQQSHHISTASHPAPPSPHSAPAVTRVTVRAVSGMGACVAARSRLNTTAGGVTGCQVSGPGGNWDSWRSCRARLVWPLQISIKLYFI